MSTCISVPVIVDGETLYKNVYTGEVSAKPHFAPGPVEFEKAQLFIADIAEAMIDLQVKVINMEMGVN